MDELELILDSLTGVDERLVGFYEKKTVGGKEQYHLRVKGGNPTESVLKLKSALDKERKDHKSVAEKYKSLVSAVGGDEAVADLSALSARLEQHAEWEIEREAGGEGGKKASESQISKLVNDRVKAQTERLTREADRLRAEIKEKDGKIDDLTGSIQRRELGETITAAARSAKVRDAAIMDAVEIGTGLFVRADDGSFVTRDAPGVTAGMTPEEWISEQQSKRPHWWPESVGGGARGGNSDGGIPNNPWSAAHWNVTEQSKYERQHGAEKAGRAAKAAGVELGAVRPAASAKK